MKSAWRKKAAALYLAGLPALIGLLQACDQPSVAGTDAGNAGKVSGIMADAKGSGLPGIEVYLRSAAFTPPLDSGLGMRPPQGKEWITLTGGRGEYEFSLDSADTGDFLVEAFDEGAVSIRLPFRKSPKREADLGLAILQRSGRISGTVKLPPGPGGDVLVVLLGTRHQAYFPKGSGSFAFQPVAPGDYGIRVEGLNPGREGVDRRITVAPGESFAVDLSASEAAKIKVLIVDGINNHDWKRMTLYHRAVLSESGYFQVDTSTTPPDEADAASWANWNPRFSDYDVVILHCNSGGGDDGRGNPWPDSMRLRLEEFVAGGGGLVNTHATFPAFLGWSAFESMQGLAWREVDPAGSSYQVDSLGVLVSAPNTADSHSVELTTPGGSGELMGAVNLDHPVNSGLPEFWLHPSSPLAYRLKGNPEGITVLTYAVNPNSGLREPQQWAKPYGRGRVFTTALGHLTAASSSNAMLCAGYQTYFVRGVEWAASGRVTSEIPSDFPGTAAASLRSNLPD